MNRLFAHITSVALFILTLPAAFAAGSHPCANLKNENLSRSSKGELLSGFCTSLFMAKIASEEAEWVRDQLSKHVNSNEEKEKWADLMAKGMASLVERNMCVEKAQAYRLVYRSRFGTEPNCAAGHQKEN